MQLKIFNKKLSSASHYVGCCTKDLGKMHLVLDLRELIIEEGEKAPRY